jgi:hypothetical protein
MLNIKDISPFMLNNKNMINILNNKVKTPLKSNKEKPIIPKQQNISDTFFCVDKNCDTLIWYFHILSNGIQSYHFLGSNSYEEENKIKINLIYKIREKKQILKNYKIKYREIESHLCNENKINLNTFLALLIISDINFFYSDDKFYYNCLINTDLDNYCYLHKKNDKYYLWYDDNKPDFNKISEKLITIDNLNKPLKTISNYKKNELEEWCKKLKIKYEFIGQKKPTKSKLYALIQENII